MWARARYSSIHRHRMMVTGVKQSASLEMTDYFFLFSLFIMLFWAIDPLVVGFDAIAGIKRFPTVLILLNLCFITVGRLMFRERSTYVSFKSVLLEMRYLVAFATLVAGGSLYARQISGIDETFLTMGVYSMMAPIIYWYTINSKAPMRLLRAILIVFVFWAVVAAGMQLGFFHKVEVFHNKEHLVLPVVGTLLYFSPWRLGKLLGVSLVMTVAVAANKNTGFILAIFVCSYLVSLSFFRRLRALHDRLQASVLLILFGLALLMAFLMVWLGYTYFDDYMPSGNPEYRTHMYAMAWDKFLSSPLWGQLFNDSAVMYFGLYDVAASTQFLPTHSDPLDILAQGGVMAFAIWLMALMPPLWRAFTKVSLHAKALTWQDEWTHQSFLLMAFTALFVCMFNPVYNVPNLATANWLVLGCVFTSTRVCMRMLEKEEHG